VKSSVLFLLVVCVLPLVAHHSFAAEFDGVPGLRDKRITGHCLAPVQ